MSIPSSSHRSVAASLSDCVIISVASFFSHEESGVLVSWCQRSSAARMIAFTMLAESKCFEPLYRQDTPVTRSYDGHRVRAVPAAQARPDVGRHPGGERAVSGGRGAQALADGG